MYSSVNTHLLHESIVLAIERIVVAQIIVIAITFVAFAALLGITDTPSLLAVTVISFLTQTLDAIIITAVILNWERTSFFITPDEIVIRQGVVELKEEVYPFSDIENIELAQDSLGKVLNYGSVYFYSQRKKEEVGVVNIPRPMYYYEIIQGFKASHDAQRRSQNNHKKPKDLPKI